MKIMLGDQYFNDEIDKYLDIIKTYTDKQVTDDEKNDMLNDIENLLTAVYNLFEAKIAPVPYVNKEKKDSVQPLVTVPHNQMYADTNDVNKL